MEEENLIFIGLLGIRDTIREEVPKAVADCKRAHIKVRMVTGLFSLIRVSFQ